MKALGQILLIASSLIMGVLANGQEPAPTRRTITLQEAVQLALKRNHVVKIAGYQVEQKQHAKEVARSRYLPSIQNDTQLLRITDTQFIEIPRGSLGTIGGTPIPEKPAVLNQGGHTSFTSGTMLVQPITQLFTKIRPQNDIAHAELEATRAQEKQTENDIALKVHKLFYLVLIAQLHYKSTEAKIQAAQDLHSERIEQVKYGSALEEEAIASEAEALQAKQELLSTGFQLSDLNLQLDDAIGLPLNTPLELDPDVPASDEPCARDACVKTALESNPSILAAREEVRKATAAVRLSKGDFVPDVTAFARYSHQNDSVPFLAQDFGTFGVHLNYELFDGGRKRAALHESDAQLKAAKENLARANDEVELAVQVAYNKVQRTQQMVSVSQKILSLRTESNRVFAQQLQNGVALRSQAANATAQAAEAQAQLLQSHLDFLQARHELTQAIGITPE
jgi:outer membrane protein TolC